MTPPVTPLDRLRELSEAATPGEWRVEADTNLVWGESTIFDDGTPDRLGVPVMDGQSARPWAHHGRPAPETVFANAERRSSQTALPALAELFRRGSLKEDTCARSSLAFAWTEIYGDIEVTIAEDGTYTCTPQPDPRATCFWLQGDTDTIDENLGRVVEAIIEWEPTVREVTVSHYTWSDGEPYRFEIDPSHGARFVKVGPPR